MKRGVRARTGLAALVGAAAVAGAVVAAGSTGDDRSARGAGTWSALASSPFQRSEVGAARIGDRIYVVGGLLGNGRTTGRMAAYDISADEWTVRRPIPDPVNHPGVTSLNGKLFVVGGQRGANKRRSRALWRYVPASNRWHRLPDAPTARAAMGIAAAGGKLFVVGGQTAGNFALRRLEVYDIGLRRWRSRTPMRKGRNHLAATVVDGFLFAIGGRTQSENLATVERWNPRRDSWRNMPSLTVPRGGIAAVAVGGSIVVFGGEDLSPGGTTIAEVELLADADPDGDWDLIESMPTPRHGLGGAARGDVAYALEGGTEPGLSTSDVAERLDLTADTP